MYYATVEGKDGDCYLNSDLKRVTDYVYAYASRGFLNNLAAVVRKGLKCGANIGGTFGLRKSFSKIFFTCFL